MKNIDTIEQIKELVKSLDTSPAEGEVTAKEIQEYYLLNKLADKLKKIKSIKNTAIKSRILPDAKKAFGNYNVWVSLSERVTLDTKALKLEYPKIYESYGKVGEVKTLNVKEID